ncbi:MAG TPA: DUF302 domain-containing protein [Myxococcaceae bacterium]|nr:DUF302 domain-containing protein [Myxococcaceae bacterium]
MGTEVSYGYTRTLPGVGYDEAITRVTEALKKEGFGVLTTIDVKETLKQKLGVEFQRYVILGACNPQLAHRALSIEPGVGLLLPCNVVVSESPQGAVVQMVKPEAMLGVVQRKEIAPIAAEADARLRRAMDQLGTR